MAKAYAPPGQRTGPSGYSGLTAKVDPIPYGLHVPYNQGYDARSRRNAPRAEDHDSSGFFSSRALGRQIDLWITEISADFSLSGQTGQSRMVREFFPRSFNDVTLKITGNVASTQEYNRLAAFIRETHWKALRQIDAGHSTDQTITFTLHNNTPRGWKPKRADSGERIRLSGNGQAGSGQAHVKGAHRDWQVSGYVKRIAAGAVRHEVAPEFSVELVVTESALDANTGIWKDDQATARVLSNFLQLFNIQKAADRVTGKGFISDPVAARTNAKTVQQGVQSVSDAVWSVSSALETLHLTIF